MMLSLERSRYRMDSSYPETPPSALDGSTRWTGVASAWRVGGRGRVRTLDGLDVVADRCIFGSFGTTVDQAPNFGHSYLWTAIQVNIHAPFG